LISQIWTATQFLHSKSFGEKRKITKYIKFWGGKRGKESFLMFVKKVENKENMKSYHVEKRQRET
jgi:hypothetical protein